MHIREFESGAILDINALYGLAASGDEAAESQLFEYLSARFSFFVRQKLGAMVDCDEIVQNTLAAILGEYRTVSIEKSFAAWAYKVLDNRLLAYLQERKRQQKRMESARINVGADNEGECPNPDLKLRLLSCLRKLGQANIRYARVLNLHYQGYATDEICAKLGLTTGNCYSVLSRARSLLDLCLDTGRIN